jgi:hypothetical protein
MSILVSYGNQLVNTLVTLLPVAEHDSSFSISRFKEKAIDALVIENRCELMKGKATMDIRKK